MLEEQIKINDRCVALFTQTGGMKCPHGVILWSNREVLASSTRWTETIFKRKEK